MLDIELEHASSQAAVLGYQVCYIFYHDML